MSDKKDLIVARLCGGLGNQLFIYAAARRIAEARGAELLLDAYSDFAKDRKYGAISQLQHFAIKADFAPKELCFSPHAGRHLRDLQVSLSKHLPLRHRFIVREADFDALCGGAPLRRLVRLEGYWQSERYFAPIADKLVDELQVVSPLSAKSREVLDRIAATQSVCVHIRQRRGAHLAFGRQPPPQAPQLPFAYYEEAVERVCRHVERPTFFCFGDNPDWMRERWKFPYPVHFVDHNRSQETAYEDTRSDEPMPPFRGGKQHVQLVGCLAFRFGRQIRRGAGERGTAHMGGRTGLDPGELDRPESRPKLNSARNFLIMLRTRGNEDW